MSDNVISPFQIKDWRILEFRSINPIIHIPPNIEHKWKMKAHIQKIESENNQHRAVIQIEFHFVAEYDNQKMMIDGQCVAMCEMNTDSVKNPETVFQDLLIHTAMPHCLANLRVFLLQAGILHQMGSKSIMLPFINLNNFVFDEEMTFTS